MAVYIWPPQSVTTLPPVGGASSANQLIEIQELEEINTKTPALVGGKVPVDTGLTPGLTDAELRATPVNVFDANAVTELGEINTEITNMNFKIPATLGSKADSASLAVTKSTEDKAAIGSLTETAPATDTASSGLNGRLQRIAQRLTSLIGLLPSSLGAKLSAASLSITPATDSVFKFAQQANQTGSFDEDLTVTTTPETFTAPAGAFACFVSADDTNTTNLRVKMGGTSSPTSGTQFQGGRSELYEGGSNISYCTESGTGKISVQWFVRT